MVISKGIDKKCKINSLSLLRTYSLFFADDKRNHDNWFRNYNQPRGKDSSFKNKENLS